MNILMGYCKCGKIISYDRMQRDPPSHTYPNGHWKTPVVETCSPRWVLDPEQMVRIINALANPIWMQEKAENVDAVNRYLFRGHQSTVLLVHFPLLLQENPGLANDLIKWEPGII